MVSLGRKEEGEKGVQQTFDYVNVYRFHVGLSSLNTEKYFAWIFRLFSPEVAVKKKKKSKKRNNDDDDDVCATVFTLLYLPGSSIPVLRYPHVVQPLYISACLFNLFFLSSFLHYFLSSLLNSFLLLFLLSFLRPSLPSFLPDFLPYSLTKQHFVNKLLLTNTLSQNTSYSRFSIVVKCMNVYKYACMDENVLMRR